MGLRLKVPMEEQIKLILREGVHLKSLSQQMKILNRKDFLQVLALLSNQEYHRWRPMLIQQNILHLQVEVERKGHYRV